MQQVKPVGRGAAVLKYDILTALGTYALAQHKGRQRLVLRLITLITARYNWARNELSIGQREIARLWSCDERTVKRELAKLRADAWLSVLRQGARGRVSVYALCLDRILADTRSHWPAVGPDFEMRLQGPSAEPTNVVPLPVRGSVPVPDPTGDTEWALAQARLHAQHPGLYAAWAHALRREARQGGVLILRAPSRFHADYVATHLVPRLLAACRTVDETVDEIAITA